MNNSNKRDNKKLYKPINIRDDGEQAIVRKSGNNVLNEIHGTGFDNAIDEKYKGNVKSSLELTMSPKCDGNENCCTSALSSSSIVRWRFASSSEGSAAVPRFGREVFIS